MNEDYYKAPAPGTIIRLLWKAAGADQYILRRSTYSDHIKYACLGGIVVATGALAAIAGGYAFYTIFSPKGDALDEVKFVGEAVSVDTTHLPTAIMSVVFGFIWGLIIFNIDRFIVTSTGKGDGTEAITRQELVGALPRIIMGVIIALTISKPVEIRMFKSEINARLQQVQDSVKIVNTKLAEKAYENNVKQAKEKMAVLYARIQRDEERRDFLDSMVSWETSHGGCHDKCEENKLERKLVEERIQTLKNSPEFVSNNQEIEEYREKLKQEKVIADKTSKALDGLSLRIQLAHEVAGTWISLFITLLFMAIELTPIFFKLMLIKSPYDFMEDNVKELIKAENGIQVQYNYYEDKNGLERHLVTYHNAKRVIDEKLKLAETQRRLSDRVINEWEKEQQVRIKENVNNFIKEDPGHV